MKIVILKLIILPLTLFVAGCATMEGEWEKAEMTNTVSSYRNFIKSYPTSSKTNEAKTKVEELRWKYAEQEDSFKALEQFLNDYPDSKFSMMAKERLNSLPKRLLEKRCSDTSLTRTFPEWIKSGNIDDEIKGSRLWVSDRELSLSGMHFIKDSSKMAFEVRRGFIVLLEGKGIISKQGTSVLVGYVCE